MVQQLREQRKPLIHVFYPSVTEKLLALEFVNIYILISADEREIIFLPKTIAHWRKYLLPADLT